MNSFLSVPLQNTRYKEEIIICGDTALIVLSYSLQVNIPLTNIRYGMNLGRGWQRIPTASSSSDLSHYLQFYMGNILSNVTSVHDRKRGQYKLLFHPENTAFCTTRERVYRARRYIWLSDTNGQQALYITMHSAWATR